MNQFNPSFLKIRKFSHFNPILLCLFDVSYTFQDCIWVVYIIWHIFVLMLNQILLWNTLEIPNKLKKKLLKWLNSRFSKYKRLYWSKVSKWTNSKIHWKLRDKNIFNNYYYYYYYYYNSGYKLMTLFFVFKAHVQLNFYVNIDYCYYLKVITWNVEDNIAHGRLK